MITSNEKQKLPITLVIPHRNRFELLKECVDSVFRLNMIPELILIIDDNSENHVIEKINNYFVDADNIIILILSENIGAPNVKNLGIALCRTKYIWFLDSDSEVLFFDSLEYAYNILESSQDIAVIGGEIIQNYIEKKFFSETVLLPNYESRFKYYPIVNTVNEPVVKEVKCIPTCNFLTKTRLLKEIGGFHPLIFPVEDKLASLELIKQNYKLVISSKFGVLHKVAQKERPDRPKRILNARRGNIFIYGAVSNSLKLPMYVIYTTISICIDIRCVKKRLENAYMFSKSLRKQDELEDKGLGSFQKFLSFKKVFSFVISDFIQYLKANIIKTLIRGARYKRERKDFPSSLILTSIGRYLHD